MVAVLQRKEEFKIVSKSESQQVRKKPQIILKRLSVFSDFRSLGLTYILSQFGFILIKGA
jgi:hypothetical protein